MVTGRPSLAGGAFRYTGLARIVGLLDFQNLEDLVSLRRLPWPVKFGGMEDEVKFFERIIPYAVAPQLASLSFISYCISTFCIIEIELIFHKEY